MAWKETASSNHPGFIGFLVHTVIRFLQFVLALTVCGLYGVDLTHARHLGYGADGKWVFAEVVGALAALTSLLFMIPFFKTYLMFAWDFVIFILWTALFGLFGKLYIKEHAEGDSAIQRMKNAVWVDLINMLLWLITAIYGLAMFFGARKGRSLHTGRATV
ncbi:MAG: hypothetical protein MMC23_005666 [Stictis urceolatum]|nr:hypothetical protein [Stictis urceolata]